MHIISSEKFNRHNCCSAKYSWLYAVVRWGTATLFGMILLFLLTIRFMHHAQLPYTKTNLFSLLGGLAMIAVAFFFGKILFGRWNWIRTHTGRLILILTVFLFFVQLGIAYNLFFYTGWDVQNINGLAFSLSQGEGFPERYSNYFSCYPNNLLLGLLSGLVMKIENHLNLFSEGYDGMALVVINCMILSFTCYMIYSVLRKMINESYAVLGYLIGVILLGLSPWMVIPYSDVWSVFVPISVLNLYISKEKKQWHTVLKWIGMLFLTVLGYHIKPQCVILPLALLIIFALTHISRRGIIRLVYFLLCAVMVYTTVHTFVLKIATYNGFRYNPNATISWPHFLMMGLNKEEHGIYWEEDVQASVGIGTSQERKTFNLTQSMKRVQDMGVVGLADHLRQKLLITFNDGMFWWGMEGSFYKQVLDPPNQHLSPWLRSFLFSTGEHYHGYASVIHALWIAVLFFVFIGALLTPYDGKKLAFSAVLLSLCGFVLFSLLFEVRSRYVITMLPLFIITAVSGMRQISVLLTTRGKKSVKMTKTECA